MVLFILKYCLLRKILIIIKLNKKIMCYKEFHLTHRIIFYRYIINLVKLLEIFYKNFFFI